MKIRIKAPKNGQHKEIMNEAFHAIAHQLDLDNHDPATCPSCQQAMNKSMEPGDGHPVRAIGLMELEFFNLIDLKNIANNVISFLGITQYIDLKKAIDDKVYYKPDGEPFTLGEIQVINNYIRDQFTIPASAVETAVLRSFIIGNIIEQAQRKGAELERRKIFLSKLPRTLQEAVRDFKLTEQEVRAIQYAITSTGEGITRIGETGRKIVIDTIIEARKQRRGASETALDLFHKVTDTDSNLNRDWKRVAISEANDATANGFLAGCKPGEQVKGVSQPDACIVCKKIIDGKVYTVRSAPPEDYSRLRPESKKYNQIAEIWNTHVWVGKSNNNRSISPRQRIAPGKYRDRDHHELVTPTIKVHPNCRCYWEKA